MIALYGKAMHDHVMRELEIGERAACYEDSEACGLGSLLDLRLEQDMREHPERWIVAFEPASGCPYPVTCKLSKNYQGLCFKETRS